MANTFANTHTHTHEICQFTQGKLDLPFTYKIYQLIFTFTSLSVCLCACFRFSFNIFSYTHTFSFAVFVSMNVCLYIELYFTPDKNFSLSRVYLCVCLHLLLSQHTHVWRSVCINLKQSSSLITFQKKSVLNIISQV